MKTALATKLIAMGADLDEETLIQQALDNTEIIRV